MKEKMMNGILKFAGKLQNNKYMSAIRNTFTALLPIIVGGAFFTLVLNVVLSTETAGVSVAKLPGMAWLETLTPMFKAANFATMSFMAIGMVIILSTELGRSNGRTETIVPVVGLSSYITLITTTILAEAPSGETVEVVNAISSQFTDARALFLGMFAAILSVEMYSRIVNSGKLDIKMPDSVPSNVSGSFRTVFPAIITIMLMAGIGQLFEAIFGHTLFDAITLFIQTPLQGVLTGLPGYLFLFFISTVLWTFGIHGTQVLGPIYVSTLLIALTENTEAVSVGLEPTNILNRAFVNIFTIPTGAGITFGLIVAILLFSTREDHRAIAKLSIVPGIFNINETMTFGLPIVLNPIFMIPFVTAPVVSATIGYTLTKIGFATPLVYDVPWTTPPLLAAFIASGGHIPTVITQALAIASSVLIYTPFVFIANKQQQEKLDD